MEETIAKQRRTRFGSLKNWQHVFGRQQIVGQPTI